MVPTTPTTANALISVHDGETSSSGGGRSGGGESLAPGLWYVHELEAVDHFAVCGGPLASPPSAEAFWDAYMRLRGRLPGILVS